MSDYEIVVSADNNPYVEWQAMLFHYSCVLRLGRSPIIVIHGEDPLREGYLRIGLAGGRIQRAPSFRTGSGHDYPPRNTAGTLASVQTDASYIVLCDPDMIFLRDEQFDSPRLGPHAVSADRSTFLRINPENRESLRQACRKAGLPVETLERHPIDAGVPIIVRRELREVLARDWLQCIDLLLGMSADELFVRAVHWLTSMWALVLSVSRLGLRVVTTDFAVTNTPGAPPLPRDPRDGPALLHYGYGDDVFEKRDFHGAVEVCRRVWDLQPVAGRTLGARIRDEVCAAREFYGLKVGTPYPAVAF